MDQPRGNTQYMRVIPSRGSGQPQRIVGNVVSGGGGNSGGSSGGPNRVHRIITSNSQHVYRQASDGVNSGQSSNVVYRAVPRSEAGVGRLVQQRTEGGGTKNIIVRPQNIGGRPVTRVIQSGNNPQVIVRSSNDPSQRQGVIRGNVITHIQANQLDGDFTDDDITDDSDESEQSEHGDQTPAVEEDPLGSGDDIDDGNDSETFETDNVVVCQFDKIQRVRSKWRFQLKDGIMSLKGKDHVFQKANGDAEW